MKKISKKLITLMLSMVMALSMSVSAFAAENDTTVSTQVEVVSKYSATPIYNGQVSFTYDSEQDFTHLFEVPSGVTYNINVPTAADALFYASSTPLVLNTHYGWDTYSTPNGLYFTNYAGKSSTAGTYELLDKWEDSTSSTGYRYKYEWSGDSWSLYTKVGEGAYTLAGAYASSYKLSDISGVKFSYETVTSDPFTSEWPLNEED